MCIDWRSRWRRWTFSQTVRGGFERAWISFSAQRHRGQEEEETEKSVDEKKAQVIGMASRHRVSSTIALLIFLVISVLNATYP